MNAGMTTRAVSTDALAMFAEGSLVDRAATIHGTATYIAALVDVVNDAIRRLQQGLDRSHGGGIGEYGDWKQMRTLLHLAEDQAERIAEQALALEDLAFDACRKST